MSDQPFLADFSPDNVGTNRFKLSLDVTTQSPAAGVACIVNVDYSSADADGGVVLPLEVLVQAPTVDGYRRQVLTRARLDQLVVIPISGGAHMVMVRELGHNRAFGALTFNVAGDSLEEAPRRRGPTA
ncbi:MAG TPA: hypothetical protein VH062_02145 [Polyangiaceae bacterium]|jgi:hypothetical protein|nr:hypothetical protein [Polyangiaceae bacterium]